MIGDEIGPDEDQTDPEVCEVSKVNVVAFGGTYYKVINGMLHKCIRLKPGYKRADLKACHGHGGRG